MDLLTPRISRRLFATQRPWLRRGPLWRNAAVMLVVFGLLRALLELPAPQLHLEGFNAATAELARLGLSALGVALLRDGSVLWQPQGFATDVHQICTAILPAALLATAIALHHQAPLRARLRGIVIGTLVVAAANQLRLVAVIWVGVQAPAWFALAHEWVAPALLVVVCLASLWAWRRTLRRHQDQTLAWSGRPSPIEEA